MVASLIKDVISALYYLHHMSPPIIHRDIKPENILVDEKMRAKMLLSIRVVREYGYQARLPYSEELEDGIFELRAKLGSDISRVLYFFVVGRKIVLTNGFIKKTRKTPKNEIDKAKRCREHYMSRKEN